MRPYWKVAYSDRYYLNKLEAAQEANGDLSLVAFNLYDKVFGKLDWTKEPEESLEDLFKQRAEQLRDQYDYLRLFYSGGYDSHTILLTFLKYKIPLDQIIVFRASPIDYFHDESNTEINERAFPFLVQIQKEIPKTAITILDVGADLFKKAFTQKDAIEHWFYRKNNWDFRSILSLNMLYHFFPELEEPAQKGKRMADILGMDKPRVQEDIHGFYALNLDSILTYYLSSDAHYNEDFFITPNLPELHIKQCHLLKKFFIKNREIDPNDFYTNPGPWVEKYNRIFRHATYNNIDVGKFQHGSTEYPWAGNLKSIIAMKQAKEFNPEVWYLYRRMYKELDSSLPLEVKNFSFNQPGVINSHIKGQYSLQYDLGK